MAEAETHRVIAASPRIDYSHGSTNTSAWRNCGALNLMVQSTDTVKSAVMETEPLRQEEPPKQSGFIQFYGLYWLKPAVNWREKQLLGQPQGWLGRGRLSADFDYKAVQMNFWDQKGVYILYDDNLNPVYAGQAGLEYAKNSGGNYRGRSIGERLSEHQRGVFRNGWRFFSWFGFLSTTKLDLKKAEPTEKMSPTWHPFKPTDNDLNQTLASFEAILIEGFAPRFNARGGDLGKAVLVDQYDKVEHQ
jgi:hypothetical protein